MKTPRDVEGDLVTEELVDPTGAPLSPDGGAVPRAVVGRSPWEIFWRQFKRDRWAFAGIVVVFIMLLLAITAPLFAKIVHHGPNDVNLRALDSFGLPSGPSKAYWFGVDGTGRDLFIRVLYGARTSLVIAFFATGMALVIGVILGMVAGFYRGKIDTLISRTTDVVLSLPILLLALGQLAALSRPAAPIHGLVAERRSPLEQHRDKGEEVRSRKAFFFSASLGFLNLPDHHAEILV